MTQHWRGRGRTKDSECSRKKKFKTREAADSARRQQNDQYLNVYECHLCNGFHLGHGKRVLSVAAD